VAQKMRAIKSLKDSNSCGRLTSSPCTGVSVSFTNSVRAPFGLGCAEVPIWHKTCFKA